MAEQRHQGRIELGGGEPESMLTHGKVRDLLSALHGCDGALVIGPGCRPCHALDAHGEVMRDHPGAGPANPPQDRARRVTPARALQRAAPL
jgi:hypothetical protein